MATLYDLLYPLDDEYIANLPKAIRDKAEQLRADTDPIVAGPIVNAKKLGGYLPKADGATGGIPVMNGTLMINLNAEKLGGQKINYFAPATHIGTNGSSHALATASLAGFMPNTHFAKVKDMLDTPTKYENYNVFGTVKVGATSIVADSYADTFEIAASSWLVLTPDETNDKLTFDLAKTALGNANHPHDLATTGSAGFMSATQVTEHNSAYSHISNNAKHHNFGKVAVGGKTLTAGSDQDTLTISAGSGISLTSVDTSDTFTVALELDVNSKALHDHVLATTGNNGFMSTTHVSHLNTAKSHADSDHNTFGTIKVGSALIDAGSLGATFEIVQGTGITLTPDATNDKLTIAISSTANADTVDNYHAGNGSGQIPISNGTLNTNLNAQKLNGKESTAFMLLDGTQAMAGKLNLGGFSVESSARVGFLNGASAQGINIGSLLVSVSYSDVNLVPANGAYIKGDITTPATVSALKFTSTQATGTAPFTVASTTKVTNLNADTLDGLHDTAFVKIDGSQAMTGNLTFPTAVKGIGFWGDSALTSYSIYMANATDSAGGRISTETESDFNMYFRMQGGPSTNRGFVFKTQEGNVVQIERTGMVHSEKGFRTKKFSIEYNSTEDSLDFNYH